MEKNTAQKLNKYLVSVFAILIIFFIFVQLFVLTNVGTKGGELTNIRNRQNELKIANEYLKAKIMQHQTNQEVLSATNSSLTVEQKQLITLESKQTTLTAQR